MRLLAGEEIRIRPKTWYRTPMALRASSLLVILVGAFGLCLGCSGSPNQGIDAATAEDASIADPSIADGWSDHVGDAPAAGADAAKDATTTGGPEVPTLCPGLLPTGQYASIVAGNTPFPDGVELLVSSGFPRFMVATDSALYWTTKNSIHRLTLGDGVDKTILDRSSKSNNSIVRVALDANDLYFTEVGFDSQYGLAKMALDGSSAPVSLAGNGSGSSPNDLAVSDGYVYYYDANLTEIRRVPVGGGDVTTLVGNVSPRSFCLANGHIYFNTELSATAQGLQAVSLDAQAGTLIDGGTATGSDGVVTLLTTDRLLDAPVFAGGNLYYGSAAKVMSLPAQGGVPTVLATPPNGLYPPIVATSGTQLYWDTGRQTCSDIVRAGLDGSGQTTIVHSLERPSLFALNSTHLFILTGSNQILRVPR